MQYSAYQKYLKYFTIWIDLALKFFLISRIFWHHFISALSYPFMPIFSLDVLFTFEFGITRIIYIFTSTCYLQSIFIHHYLNTFSLKFILESLLAFSVTSSPLYVSKIVIVRTPKCCCCWQLAKLPSCIIASPSNTAINSFIQNSLQNQFLECIPNLLHNCTSSIQRLCTDISYCLLPVSLHHYISFIVTSLEPRHFLHF